MILCTYDSFTTFLWQGLRRRFVWVFFPVHTEVNYYVNAVVMHNNRGGDSVTLETLGVSQVPYYKKCQSLATENKPSE